MTNRANKKAQAAQNAYNEHQADPATIREKFEGAGFNPLLGLNGWAPPQQHAIASNAMGSAVAEAGAIAQGYLSDKAAEESENTKLRESNRELQKRLGDKYLRPVVGGIFGGGDRAVAGAPVVGNTDPVMSRRPLPRGADPRLYDERPDVWILDHASKEYRAIPAGVADRVNLNEGDTWVAEDNAVTGGEVLSELVTARDWISGTIGQLGLKPLEGWTEPEWAKKPKKPVVPLKLHFNREFLPH